MGSALWATVTEIMPVQAKAIVGTLLGVAAASSAAKAWLNKLDEQKEQDEDQQPS
ncbi:hypothetical protein GCM10027290_38570 [Micromonospora sonneratiae]